LFFLADLLLTTSVAYAVQARGRGAWILWIAIPLIALLSFVATYLLCMAGFLSHKPSF
jgi:hypothetical protein